MLIESLRPVVEHVRVSKTASRSFKGRKSLFVLACELFSILSSGGTICLN